MQKSTIHIASAFLLLLGACGEVTEPENGGNPADDPSIETLVPDNVPLSGGIITVSGSGFTDDMTIIVGTKSIGDFSVLGDDELELAIPAGTSAGELVSLTLVTNEGLAMAEDAIVYNALPTITASRPPVVALAGNTPITITGTLFQTNNEGPVTAMLGDIELSDVNVVDDQTITATVPAGTVADVGVAQELTIETRNGVASLKGANTYVSPGGLLFSQPRVRSTGGVLIPEIDQGLGVYYFDPATKRNALVQALTSGIGDLVALPSGDIGTRFSRNGSMAYNRAVLGVLDLANGSVSPELSMAPTGQPLGMFEARTMTNHNGQIYAIGDARNSPNDGTINQLGTVDPSTGDFTSIANTNGGLGQHSCIVPGLNANSLTAIRFMNTNIQTITISNGTVTDGGAFTGDLLQEGNTERPRCHGATRVGGVVYAIQFFRDNGQKARLVTVAASGQVTFVADLPLGAAGLVAMP